VRFAPKEEASGGQESVVSLAAKVFEGMGTETMKDEGLEAEQ